nr:MAG TPA: hypothetical protein [Caudoviricetes sp.]
MTIKALYGNYSDNSHYIVYKEANFCIICSVAAVIKVQVNLAPDLRAWALIFSHTS